MTQSDFQSDGISVPARTIPTPRSISPEAQAFLSKGLTITPPTIEPNDKEGWKRYIGMVENQLVVISAARAKPYPAEIVEHALSNATLYEVTPATLSATSADNVVFHIHGGAFIVGGGRTAAHTAQPIASATGLKAFSVDYRMPPDYPFPAALNDALEAYQWLLARYRPSNIAVQGSSAGANLAAAVILKARELGLPLPGACALHTAGVDLTHSGDTFATNATIDVVLRGAQSDLMLLYASGHDLKDPFLSPVFGDFSKGFPPTILLSGTRDLLLSPTVMLHRALRRAGVEAELHVFEAMPHGGFGDTAPEDKELLSEMARFIVECLARDSRAREN